MDEQMKRQELFANRIYLILFILSLIGALLYAGPLNNETKTTSIKNPSSNLINSLYARNISTLSCPCSVAAIRYSKFLSIIPKRHSICSSDYVKSSYWINLLKNESTISKQLGTHYSVLSSLCEQTHRIIKNAENSFDTRELVGAETMTHSTFIIQTEDLVSTFISQLSSDYRRTLTFIIRSFGVNHLLNVFTNNWKLNFTDENEKHRIATYPRRFSSSNCSCATSFDCNEQIKENIVRGCFPFDGFRLSKFQNISLGQLNDQLFVEKWKNKSNYSAYFQECRPLKCEYTLPDRNNPINMLTTILALYGGKIKI